MEKEKNIGFFKKVWYSVAKFEKYPEMAAEGVKNAIIYLVILSCILSVFLAIGSIKNMYKMVQDIASYIEQNIPEFTYSDNQIQTAQEEQIVISDLGNSTINKIIIDPKAENDEQKTKIEEENKETGIVIYFYKNQVVLVQQPEDAESIRSQYTYKDFLAKYTQDNIDKFNKEELVDYMTSNNMTNYYLRYGTTLVVYLAFTNILIALLNALELAVLGWITSIVARIKMNNTAIYNMAIYSITLPVILNIIYVIVNYFTEFTMTYFQVAYITIAYVYLAAAIFIIKDDFMKKQQEVEKIKQEQIKVRAEIRKEEQPKEEDKKDEKEEKKDKEEEKETKDNNDEEPNGSEA